MKIHPKLSNDKLTIEEISQKLILENKKEHLYFYKNGKQIARFEGESNYVNPSQKHLFLMKDCDVLHNHLQGSSFSFEDVAAIITHNAKQLMVYSNDYTYIVKRPENGWGFDFAVSKNGLLISDEQTIAIFEESRNIIEDMLFKMERRGEITQDKRREEENHYIWKNFFELKNVYYERIRN